MKSEDVIAAKGRPFTGAEYLASLRDGRDVYVYGERVDDVTTHPAFRNAARSIARLYDALPDAKTKDGLTWPTATGSGGYTHKFVRGDLFGPHALQLPRPERGRAHPRYRSCGHVHRADERARREAHLPYFI